jgi:hypothetical protein
MSVLMLQSLLIELQSDHNMFSEMYQHGAYDVLPAASISAGIPDPNHRNANDSLHYWLPLCDWYSEYMPHVILYDSFHHLVQLLNTTTEETLLEVSRRMKEANRITEKRTMKKWKHIIYRVRVARNVRNVAQGLRPEMAVRTFSETQPKPTHPTFYATQPNTQPYRLRKNPQSNLPLTQKTVKPIVKRKNPISNLSLTLKYQIQPTAYRKKTQPNLLLTHKKVKPIV